MTTTQTKVQLGERVIFRDHQGLPKLAFVTGTMETIDSQRANGEVPQIREPDEAHLMVCSPTGTTYGRHNIRYGTGPGQWSMFGDAGLSP